MIKCVGVGEGVGVDLDVGVAVSANDNKLTRGNSKSVLFSSV